MRVRWCSSSRLVGEMLSTHRRYVDAEIRTISNNLFWLRYTQDFATNEQFRNVCGSSRGIWLTISSINSRKAQSDVKVE